MKRKILGDKNKSNFDDNLADYVNELAEKGELKQTSEPVIIPPVDLSKLTFELDIPHTSYMFDESLKDLRSGPNKLGLFERDYTRHPRPREIFEYLSITSSDIIKRHNFFRDHTEWTSCAFKKEGNKLFVALDPENLVSDNAESSYVLDGSYIVCSELREFDIGNKPLKKQIILAEFPDDLIDYLYGSIRNNSEIIKNFNPKIWFMEEWVWLPVSIRKYDLCQDYSANSRGVKVSK